VHGLPEIAAYFIGAIAGGILSMAVVKQDFSKQRLKDVLHDFITLVFIAIVFLFFAGILEVFLTSRF
jgi:uncharacterized membrane protein SpoIIM required for sporulation